MEKQVDFSDQEKKALPQGDSRIKKTHQITEKSSLKFRIELTFFICWIFLCLSFYVFFVYKFIDSWMFGLEVGEAFTVSLAYSLAIFLTLITGLEFSFSGGFFLFPFSPLIISLLVIFAFVSILEKWGLINGNKINFNLKMRKQANFADQDERKEAGLSLQSGVDPFGFHDDSKDSKKGRFDFIGNLLMAIAVYLALFCLAVVILYFIIFFDFDPDGGLLRTDFREVAQMVFFVGVLGVIPLFGGGAAIFDLPPFTFLLGALAIIFGVITVLEQSQVITRNRKKFKKILAVPIFLFAGTFIFDEIVQFNQYSKIEQEKDYYRETYETKRPVKSDARFIYPGEDDESGDILVSGIYGEDKERLFSSEKKNIGYISPNGKHFVSCDNYGRYRGCGELLSVNNLAQKTELCFMETSIGAKVCPKFCTWDVSGESFVCNYRFNGFIDKQKELEASKHDVLVVFDPQNGGRKVVVDRESMAESDDYVIPEDQNFAFLDEDTLIFTSLEKRSKFFKAEKINSCDLKITKLENLASCKNFTLVKDGIYCSVKAEDHGIEIEDEDNFEVKSYEHFIIRQELSQSSKEDFEVINKAPIPEPEVLIGFNDNYIFALPRYGGSYKIIETESGLMRDLGGGFEWEEDYIEEDERLIFKKGEDVKKIPKVYLEEASDSERMRFEQCDESNSARSFEATPEVTDQGGVISDTSRKVDSSQAPAPEGLEFGVDDVLIFLDGQERYVIKRLFKREGVTQGFLAHYQVNDMPVVNGFEMAEIRVNIFEEESSTEELYQYLLEKQQENGTNFDYNKVSLGSHAYIKKNSSFYWTRSGRYQVGFLIKHPSDKVDWESFEKMLGSLKIKL